MIASLRKVLSLCSSHFMLQPALSYVLTGTKFFPISLFHFINYTLSTHGNKSLTVPAIAYFINSHHGQSSVGDRCMVRLLFPCVYFMIYSRIWIDTFMVKVIWRSMAHPKIIHAHFQKKGSCNLFHLKIILQPHYPNDFLNWTCHRSKCRRTKSRSRNLLDIVFYGTKFTVELRILSDRYVFGEIRKCVFF